MLTGPSHNNKKMASELSVGTVRGTNGSSIIVPTLPTVGSDPIEKQQGDLCFVNGTIRFSDGIDWYNINETAGADGSSPEKAAESATAIKNLDPSVPDGLYWIKPTGWPSSAIQVYCDMTTDGGGWMMIGYAGTITTSKSSTVGGLTPGNSSYWLPLFNTYGSIQTDSKSTRVPFSRMDFAKGVANIDDSFSHLMARRTDNPDNILIWNIADWQRFDSTNSANWSFNPDPGLPILQYFKMSNSGPSGLASKLGSPNGARYENGPSYPGIAWNSTYNENSNGYGGYTNALNRRSILYWETQESSYQNNQWFHAAPMNLAGAPGPDNSVQDVEFYFREAKPA